MTRAVHRDFIEIAGGISERLQEAIAEHGPVTLRRRREVPLPELLCRIVTGQQLSGKAAATIWGRVVASANQKTLSHHIATARPQQLRKCGMSAAKAKTMKAIVQAEADGLFDLDALGHMDHNQRSAQLTKVWGVGQWTADMVSISYFGDQDVWPENDVTVWKTLERLTSRRRKTTNTAQRFAPCRTFLALYMWRIADAEREK